MHVRPLVTVGVLAVALLGTSAPTPVAVATTPPAAAATTASPDFDGDGKADLAFIANHFPVVHDLRVRYGGGTTAVFTPVQVTDSDDGDLFGPLLARDLDADGYTDLAFLASLDLHRHSWRLYTLYGSSSGLQRSSLRVVALPEESDGYGYATYGPLALVTDPVPRLVIGQSPGTSHPDSRQLLVYGLDGDGQPSGDPVVLDPSSKDLPAIGSDRGFGVALAAAGNRLFVGANDADVSGNWDAGAVVALSFDTGGVSSAEVVTQATAGVGGDPAKYDWFGYSLAANDGYLVVGAPGDTIGKGAFTGSVQVFATTGDALVPTQWITQGSKGVPGKDEAGDQFGSAVALGTVCPGVPGVAVGAVHEEITSDANGSAWVIPLTITSGCKAYQLYEGNGLSGKPKRFRELGSNVAVLRNAGAEVDEVVIAARGTDFFSDPGRLFIWSSRTHKQTYRLDDSPTSVAGR